MEFGRGNDMNHPEKRTIITLAAVAMLAAGCSKKVAVAPPQPPAATAARPAAATSRPAPTPVRAAEAPRQSASTPAPASRYPSAATRARIDQLLAKIEDAYFDYDKSSLRPDALKALQSDSTELRDILKDYPDYKLTIEGHCDERGSDEYNVALGDRRAQAAKDYLVQVGIPSSQLNLISYGKMKPICSEHDEACWQRNRRIHILAMAR
jgi:peptidoglycan-associated lipoprotein